MLDGEPYLKCVLCRRRAFYTASWDGRSYCPEHYVEVFIKRVEKLMQRLKFRPKLVLAAVSGGKDSVAMLDVISCLADKYGFDVVGFTLDLEIRGFSQHYVEVAINAFKAVGIPYVVARVSELLGLTLDDVARRSRRDRPVCSVCGMIKRRAFEEYAQVLGADTIATGHNRDDIIAFNLVSKASGQETSITLLDLGGETGIARFRPLGLFSESDTLAYVLARNLPFTETPCPYKPGETLADFFKHLYSRLYSSYPAVATKLLRINTMSVRPEIGRRCVYCGSPTQTMVCSTCRTVSKVLGGNL